MQERVKPWYDNISNEDVNDLVDYLLDTGIDEGDELDYQPIEE